MADIEITAMYNVYNADKWINKSICSIKDYVTRICVFDQCPDTGKISNDGTRSKAHEIDLQNKDFIRYYAGELSDKQKESWNEYRNNGFIISMDYLCYMQQDISVLVANLKKYHSLCKYTAITQQHLIFLNKTEYVLKEIQVPIYFGNDNRKRNIIIPDRKIFVFDYQYIFNPNENPEFDKNEIKPYTGTHPRDMQEFMKNL